MINTSKLIDLPRDWSFETYKNKYTDKEESNNKKKLANASEDNIFEVLNGQLANEHFFKMML